MSDSHDGFASGDGFSGLLADLALTELGGRERAAVLTHIAQCSSCRAQLRELTLLVDELLLLAPEEDPPAGFESRVVRRLVATRPRPRALAVRVAVAVVVTVIAVAGGIAAGRVGRTRASTARGATPPGVALTGSLIIGGADHGDVVIMSGHPEWLFMSVRDAGWTQVVSCSVTLAGGRSITVGSFAVSSGYGSWGAALPVQARQLRSVDLTDARGSPVGHAQLSP